MVQDSIQYCKVTNFRPVPIFVHLTLNWYELIFFVLSRASKQNYVKFDGLETKIKFHPVLKFALFSKV